MKFLAHLKALGAMSWCIIATAAFLVALMAWATSHQVSREREQAIAQWTANNTNQVNADESRIRRTIATLDRVLLVIRQDLRDKRVFTRQELAGRVRQLSVSDDLSPQLTLIDAQGVLQLTTAEPARVTPDKAGNTGAKSRVMSMADRDYFKHQRNATTDELWIGVPIQSRVSGLMILTFTRRITQPDGSFGGVLTMSVNPEVFDGPFRQTDVGENGSLAIIGLDGFTRVRKTGKNNVSYGDDVRKSQVFQEIQKSLAGSYSARSAFDGVLRTISYRVIAPYALVVVTARSIDEIIQSVAGRVRLLWAVGALLCGLLTVLTAVMVVYLMRQRQTIAALRAASELRVALRSSEQSFQQLLQLIPQLVITLDKTGDVHWVNQPTRDYIGAAALGAPSNLSWTHAALHPDDQCHVMGLLNAALRDTRASPPCDLRLRRHDGEYRWFSSQITPMLDSQGMLIQWLGTCTDIHDHTLASERLLQTQKMEVIGQLTGGLAHDFNNLLAIIIVNLDLMAAAAITVADEKGALRAQLALRAAERGAAVVKSLMALAGRHMLAPQRAELRPLLEGMAPIIQQALGVQVKLVLELAPQPLWVLVDLSGLESAVLNLVVNARDAMPDGGQFTVSLAATHPMWATITLRDTGTGMSAPVLARATEPFFTTKERGLGTGLGLAMVAGFVRQSAGHLALQSAPGKGTTITIELPLVATDVDVLLPPEHIEGV